jgi:hypothetical protein
VSFITVMLEIDFQSGLARTLCPLVSRNGSARLARSLAPLLEGRLDRSVACKERCISTWWGERYSVARTKALQYRARLPGSSRGGNKNHLLVGRSVRPSALFLWQFVLHSSPPSAWVCSGGALPASVFGGAVVPCARALAT